MKIIEPSFEILQFPEDIRLLEIAGRNCYKSDKIDTDNFIRKIIKKQHLSVIEHLVATVKITCDRGISHELVRHRLASYSQSSTRYCNYAKDKFGSELTFIKPCFWEYDSIQYQIWLQACQADENHYLDLIQLQTKPEEARSILSNSLMTEVIMTANLRSWLEMFPKRCSQQSHPQMRQIMIPLREEFRKRCSVVFGEPENIIA